MNKKLLVALTLLLILSTYNFKNDNLKNTLNIKDILVDNNKILTKNEVETELSFLLDKNLFTLNTSNIQDELKKNSFIESFEIKKIYPDTLKIKVFEKKPIAIIQDKKNKYLYSDNNELIIYDGSKEFDNLP
ncbi:MAG: FtsQ-type POTRA domain-containing protein, partial [Pseudomonadota bacterium]|nr:FtsQ-type POTRA domain-containing protein [Pseudomonadota bacterium]